MQPILSPVPTPIERFGAGLSVVVVTDNDMDKAERIRDELLESAWQERQVFVYIGLYRRKPVC